MEKAPTGDIDLYFKGIILPKTISTEPLIDLENGFVLCDERKENLKSFSSLEIYKAIKKQNPELLNLLRETQIVGYDQKEFINILDKEQSIQENKKENTSLDTKVLNTIFSTLKSSLKGIFYKDSKVLLSNTKITLNDDNYCLAWLKSDIFEVYAFANLKTATYIEYFINGKSNRLKNTIDQKVLDAYKSLLSIWKNKYVKLTNSKISAGANIINKNIVEKHFSKNLKYYILDIDLENKILDEEKLQLYITLKKVKNAWNR